jgi:hypothetical protein
MKLRHRSLQGRQTTSDGSPYAVRESMPAAFNLHAVAASTRGAT